MALAKPISFLSLTLFLVILTTITRPKGANAQLVTLNNTTINITGTALCSPTVFGPCLLSCTPLANVTVQIQLLGVTIATGVTAADGSLSIPINAGTTNIPVINIDNLTARVNVPLNLLNLCPILGTVGSVLQGVLTPVGNIVNGVLTVVISSVV